MSVCWQPEEDRIIARYAKGVVSGRYPSATAATEACMKELIRLFAAMRRRNPGHPLARLTRRNLASLRARVTRHIVRMGVPWTGRVLGKVEERVVERYVLALAQGRYRDGADAGRACHAELVRLRRTTPGIRPRTPNAIIQQIHKRAAGRGILWAGVRWTKEEDAELSRFARAVDRGEYRDAGEAVPDCGRALARVNKATNAAGRPESTVYARLTQLLRAMGRRYHETWSPAENAVLARYVKLVFEGRYPGTMAAARVMARELTELRRRNRERPRRFVVVQRTLAGAVAHAGLPRFKGLMTPQERELAEKYARAKAAGKYPRWIDAAADCREELRRLHAAAGRKSRYHVSRPLDRSIGIIGRWIVLAAVRLGLHTVTFRTWKEEERRICDGWVKWYDRHRTTRRLRPLAAAAEGLQEELADKGYTRTRDACGGRIKYQWLRRHGLL